MDEIGPISSYKIFISDFGRWTIQWKGRPALANRLTAHAPWSTFRTARTGTSTATHSRHPEMQPGNKKLDRFFKLEIYCKGGPRYMRSFYLWFHIYATENWLFFQNLSSSSVFLNLLGFMSWLKTNFYITVPVTIFCKVSVLVMCFQSCFFLVQNSPG